MNKKFDILLGENESLLTEENYKIYYTAKVISKFNKVESELQIGNMQYLGIQNEYGDVYSVTQDNGLIESSDKRPLTAFFKSE